MHTRKTAYFHKQAENTNNYTNMISNIHSKNTHFHTKQQNSTTKKIKNKKKKSEKKRIARNGAK